jgi:hypothetical protein
MTSRRDLKARPRKTVRSRLVLILGAAALLLSGCYYPVGAEYPGSGYSGGYGGHHGGYSDHHESYHGHVD